MIEAELPDGRILEFPDGTDPQVIQSAVKRVLSESQAQTEQPQTAQQKPDQESGRGPLADVALEGMAAFNRGATRMADFLTTDQINAVSEILGSEFRVPSITEKASAGTQGNFMEEGLGRDVVRSAGELVAPGVAGGQIARQAAQRLPQFAAQTEGVIPGAIRQAGQTTMGREGVLAATTGAGGELGGAGGEVAGEQIGGMIGGEEGAERGAEIGRAAGQMAGSFAAPIAGAVTKEALDSVRSRAARRLLSQSAPTIDNLKQASREVYREIDDLGATVNSNRVTRLSNELSQSVRKEGFNRRIHPKVAAALREFEQVEGTDQALSNIDTLRRVAGSAAQSIEPDEARLGRLMVDKVDDFLENLGPNAFVGGNKTKVGPLYRDARQMWRRAKKAEIVEEAMGKARNQASGFENGLRTQFRSILNNKRVRRNFNEDELAAMRRVVQGGSMENLTKAIGKFGFSEDQAVRMLMPSLGVAGGAAVGGPAGAVAVPLVGQVSRSLSQKLTRNNAQLVDEIVRAGSSGRDVARAYVRSVPRGERSAEELAELLLRPDVSLGNLRGMGGDGDVGRLVSDAAYLANTLRMAEEQENEEGDEDE